MFTIAFRDGRDGTLEYGARPLYNEEYIRDSYKSVNIKGRIGQSFTDFVSFSGNIAKSKHPYIRVAGEFAEGISENSYFLVQIREYLDLVIDNDEFFTLGCFMFFLDLVGLSIPACHHQLQIKKGHENDSIEGAVVTNDTMSTTERCLRGFLAIGNEIYDVPLTVYECETIEDACMATLHFLITHGFSIRKCKNCGKYFVAYNRSDTVYCDRQSPFNNGKTCKADGPIRAYNASVSADELKKLIANTQAMWRMRRSRFPNDKEYAIGAERFKADLRIWKADYAKGKATKDEFVEWLQESKNR